MAELKVAEMADLLVDLMVDLMADLMVVQTDTQRVD
jgi:hypothetical protein